MKSKHKFVPSQVVPLEERALLSTAHFPVGIGPVITLGLSGNRVLTASTYAAVSHAATIDIEAFRNSVIAAFNADSVNNGNGTFTPTAAFFATVGIGELGNTALGAPNGWSYPPGTLLATLDAQMGALEFKLPFGGGLGINLTGGSGLSDKTALTTRNPQSLGLAVFFGPPISASAGALPGGVSVSEDLGFTLTFEAGSNLVGALPTTAAALLSDMNAVLTQAVSTSPTDAPTAALVPGPVATGLMTLGILPGYVQAGGPGGARLFGLKDK